MHNWRCKFHSHKQRKMNRFISITDLMFLLLASLSIGIMFSSPQYNTLNVNLPEAEGGSDRELESKTKIVVTQNAISVEDRVFQSIDEFEEFISSSLYEEVILKIDSDVKFERIAEILGIINKVGVRSVKFEVKSK